MKNVYIVQPGYLFESTGKAFYIPYAAGVIAAQAWSNETVKASFSLEDIFFIAQDIDEAVERYNEPFLVAFSCYVWNFEYDKILAKRLKERYPECTIVFGGHHVPPGTVLLEDCPFIDVLIHGEGEEAFEKLLEALALGKGLDTVSNLSYRIGDEKVSTKSEPCCRCDYPSPYTGGFFDKLLRENPDINFSCILETNRGCTNNCAFCDWGPHKIKARMFPLERVKGDIEWFAEKKIKYIWGADANFGQFPRDEEITRWLVEAKKKSGYPMRIKVNYAKINTERVENITKLFADADMSKSTTVSLQTTCDTAQKNIGRLNMPREEYADIISTYNKLGIPTYTELILGLPGETYESFLRGLDMIISSGQHSSIVVYDCELLPNAKLADKNYIREHKIETRKIPFIQYHSPLIRKQTPERSTIVVSTATLTTDDWISCKLFYLAVMSLHCFGLLRFFAIYLHTEKSVSYDKFYTSLLDWFFRNEQTLGNSVFSKLRRDISGVLEGKNEQYFCDPALGDMCWMPEEGITLQIVQQFDRFYDEVRSFLESFDIDIEVLNELFAYQKFVVNTPDKRCRSHSFKYDFESYFRAEQEGHPVALVERANSITAHDELCYTDILDYVREIVWFGNRLGLSVFSEDRVDVEYVE